MLGLNGRQVLPGTSAGRPIACSHGDVIRIQLPRSNLWGLISLRLCNLIRKKTALNSNRLIEVIFGLEMKLQWSYPNYVIAKRSIWYHLQNSRFNIRCWEIASVKHQAKDCNSSKTLISANTMRIFSFPLNLVLLADFRAPTLKLVLQRKLKQLWLS